MIFESIPFEKNTHLTPAHKKVIKYILEHYEEAIFLTASRLS
jgi:DNA-binding MurR/RpiR family transcriptional regulator